MHAMHAIIVVIAVRLSALDLFVLYCVCIVCSAELSSFLHHLTPLRNFQCAFFFSFPLVLVPALRTNRTKGKAHKHNKPIRIPNPWHPIAQLACQSLPFLVSVMT
ncbi:hypothetical protein K457DRAFT_201283 [Linnemannia elongata AG-77]|uniref:Uncharacterized protein n=1 Tax=Linnemannia elongata AG-77 TaxID=1314771 RepID=A0A197JGJ0_9FUNG|nr:hypothetical protein K457DRAFT_201283 [Linnemannia elongata AG-77]